LIVSAERCLVIPVGSLRPVRGATGTDFFVGNDVVVDEVVLIEVVVVVVSASALEATTRLEIEPRANTSRSGRRIEETYNGVALILATRIKGMERTAFVEPRST
jgi:hypothetical protein